MSKHKFYGILGHPCEECGKPGRDPIHVVVPEKKGHTPGPWASDGKIVPWSSGERPAVRVTYQRNHHTLSPVAMCDPRVGERRVIANAALIARAPEMAEEIERLTSVCGEQEGQLQVVRTQRDNAQWVAEKAYEERDAIAAQRDALAESVRGVAERLRREPSDVLHGGNPMIDRRCVLHAAQSLRTALEAVEKA